MQLYRSVEAKSSFYPPDKEKSTGYWLLGWIPHMPSDKWDYKVSRISCTVYPQTWAFLCWHHHNIWCRLRPVATAFAPSPETALADLSITILRQITPFLVSDKTSKLYIAWQEQQHQYQQRITKELILDVVQRFEAQLDLKLTEKKRLPQHLGFSQTDPITVDTRAAGIQARSSSSYLTDRSPSNHQKHKSSERRSSQDRNSRGQCLDRSKHQDTRDKTSVLR